jgi:hypothetical protein
MKRLCYSAISWLVLAVLVNCGCKPGNPNAPASVSGKVTYKNEPVTAGMVYFHTSEGAVYTCIIKPDGTYAGSDMPAGELTVTVETEMANPDVKAPTYGGGGQGQAQPAGPPRPKEAGGGSGAYVKIPAKYKDKKTSGLKETLSKGKNTKNIDLTD